MGVNSLPKTVTDSVATAIVNPGPSAPGSSTLTTRLPSHAKLRTNRPKVIQDVHSAVSREQSVLNFCSTATRLQRDRRKSRLRRCTLSRPFGTLGQHSLPSFLGR